MKKPESGSKWTFAHILTFRILLQKREDEFPSFLDPLLSAAKEKPKSSAFLDILELLRDSDWSHSSRDTIRETGKKFGPFLGYLAEVIETPWSSEELRVSNRLKPLPQYHPLIDDEEDFNEDEREQYTSGLSDTTDHSHEDQDALNRQNKSETVTNFLIIEYLQSLAQCTRGPDDRDFHLEWTTDQDAFNIQVPSEEPNLISKNDGGLVHRGADGQRHWARVKPLSCYCSIEASTYTRVRSVLAKHDSEGQSGAFRRR